MIYDLIAPIYDKINEEIDYSSWADFIEKIIERNYEKGKPELLLDLGCGTGRMTVELAKRGYDMTGVDYSVEMLDAARARAAEAGLDGKILWLCQDIRAFELYGTVDVTVSCLDTLNHLTTPADLRCCFSLVHNYLDPDGLFMFDVNSPYKFEKIYGDNAYILEDEGVYCGWQNFYDEKSGVCDFYLSIFEEEDGQYYRCDEHQQERCYTKDTLCRLLTESGFEVLEIVSDFDFTEPKDNTERYYIVARAKK